MNHFFITKYTHSMFFATCLLIGACCTTGQDMEEHAEHEDDAQHEIHEQDTDHDHPVGIVEDEEAVIFTREQQSQVEFATETAEVREVIRSVSAYGVVKAYSSAQSIMPAPIDGIIQYHNELEFLEIGSEVQENQQLFSLEPLADWSTGLVNLRREYELAKLELERQERLWKDEATSAKRLTEARIRHRILVDSLNQLGISMDSFDSPNNRGAVLSPITGMITELMVIPGQRVKSGDPLAVIVDTSKLILEVIVPTTRLHDTDAVTDAWFHVAGCASPYHVSELGGRLLSRTPIAKAEDGLFALRFLFDNPEDHLVPGSKATTFLLESGQTMPVLAIPRQALNEDEGRMYVYVQTGIESFEKRWLKLGDSDGQWIEVISGIKTGELVVTKGSSYVRMASMSTGEMGHGHAH